MSMMDADASVPDASRQQRGLRSKPRFNFRGEGSPWL